ncbi:MAG: hypothetical protein WCK05_10230 [Planctomycetota bacterium]
MNATWKKWQFLRIDMVAGGVMIAGLAVSYVLTVMPQKRMEEACKEQQKQLIAQKANAVMLVSLGRRAGKELTDLRREIETNPIQFESAGRMNTRIAALTKLASETALKIEQIQPGEPTADGRFSLVPINLNGAGPYRSWIELLARLPKAFPDFEIASFDLVGNPSETGSTTAFRLCLTWYALPPEALTKR